MANTLSPEGLVRCHTGRTRGAVLDGGRGPAQLHPGRPYIEEGHLVPVGRSGDSPGDGRWKRGERRHVSQATPAQTETTTPRSDWRASAPESEGITHAVRSPPASSATALTPIAAA
jgi:hypothetical protein